MPIVGMPVGVVAEAAAGRFELVEASVGRGMACRVVVVGLTGVTEASGEHQMRRFERASARREGAGRAWHGETIRPR
eukprot:6206185-Pleurochrysis_carterae.AAC.3